uniref:T-box domain-containing protein n=1 Tax=Panagrolaimus davidi TaxID=227884 RepID=A0A914PM61_9BILA
MFVKKTFITGILKVYYGNTVNLSANDPRRLFISSLIPHLFRCEAKYLHICDQSLSFDEVKFLIEHGNVVEFHLSTSTILDENGQYVHLEEIMKYLPNVEELALPNIKVNSKTGHALTKLNFKSKISIFSIHAIFGVSFDGNEFLKFVKANRDDKLDLRMKFNGFNFNFVTKFIEIMNDYKMSCGYVENDFSISSV